MTKKLLLADDSVTIQRVIGIIFATEDYQLLVTDNGDEAYEKAQQEIPDLVIADVSMPGKDGFELCEALKSNPRLAKTAVMLLPGTFDHFDEERARAVGADGWLSKPFESQALLDKVEQLLAAEPVSLEVPGEQLEESVAAQSEDTPAEHSAAALAAAGAAVAATPESELDAADLGLETVDADAPEVATEDIWDAVSFEEDELEAGAEVDQGSPAEPEALGDDELAPEVAAASSDQAELNIDAESIGFSAAEEAEPAVNSASGFDRFVDDSDDLLDLGEEQVEETAGTELLATAENEAREPQSMADPTELSTEALATESLNVEGLGFAAPALDESAEADQEDELLEVVPLDEAELAADEEILDLAEEDILAEEPLAEPAAEETVEPLVAEESAENVFDLSDEAAQGLDENLSQYDDSLPKNDLGAEEAIVSAEPAEGADAEEPFAPLQDFAAEEPPADIEAEEDDGFFFDAAAEDDESPVVDSALGEVAGAAGAGLATGVAATAMATEPGPSDEAPIQQVEQQLRELSEEELKAVVAKVAGPMIEKLASEMLEQIAWEVVPDLAESMIREEIRRLKQGVE